MSSNLQHNIVYENYSEFKGSYVPLIKDLQSICKVDRFPLVLNPRASNRASIMGMFVLRPGRSKWTQPIINQEGKPTSLHDVMGWSYNFEGLEGGWLLSNGNALDSFRLALQYGISDAVIVGSKTVSDEGCDVTNSDGSIRKGYIWQYYGPCEWPQLASLDTNLSHKLALQREFLQAEGILSNRKYAAQIFVTWSGIHNPESNDILDARVLYETHPTGEPFEVYIISSTNGCKKLRERAMNKPHIRDRIDNILIDLSPIDDPDDIDLSSLPSLLYEKYDIRIVNHDGGKGVLRKFVQAGIITQINLTLCRKYSLYEIIEKNQKLSSDIIQQACNQFDERIYYYFNNKHTCTTTTTTTTTPIRVPSSDDLDTSVHPSHEYAQKSSIPYTFKPIQIITDNDEDVAVCIFDTTTARDF